MICTNFSSIVGLHCTPVDDAGEIALIQTPFRFSDGDAMPIYARGAVGGVKFFDDCGTLWHLAGRGVDVNDGRRLKPVTDIIEAHGITLTEAGQLELWAPMDGAPDAFAKFTQALLAVAAWERSSQDAEPDGQVFVEDVAQAIEQWCGVAPERNVQFQGVTGQYIAVDLVTEHGLVYACKPRSQSTSATLRKLIDLNNGRAAGGMAKWAVIDDREDHEAAARESLLLSTVAEVMTFSRLLSEGLVGKDRLAH